MALIIPVDHEITLRLVEPHFAEEIFAAIDPNRQHLGRWLPWVAATKTPDDLRAWIESAVRKFAERQMLPLSVLRDGKVVGGVGLNDMEITTIESQNVSFRKADIGYWLAESAQGQGVMARCVRAVCRIGFEEYGLTRITIRAEPDNARSLGVPERCGFTLEGTLRDICRWNGRIINHRLYAMSEADWRNRPAGG